jgi:hypothetical protein
MANEICFPDQTGLNFYGVLRIAGTVYNGATFEAPVTANWTNYDLAFTEASTTGFYFLNMPAVAAGYYDLFIYQRAGGTPAVTDGPPVAHMPIDWDGAAAVSLQAAFTVASANALRAMFGATASQSWAVDTATFTATTTVFETTDAVNKDLFTDQGLYWTSGTNKGQTSHVSGYAYSGNSKVKLTLSAALPNAPANGDTFQIIGRVGN